MWIMDRWDASGAWPLPSEFPRKAPTPTKQLLFARGLVEWALSAPGLFSAKRHSTGALEHCIGVLLERLECVRFHCCHGVFLLTASTPSCSQIFKRASSKPRCFALVCVSSLTQNEEVTYDSSVSVT